MRPEALCGEGTSRSFQPCEEQHFPVRYWAEIWGYSPKTIRSWFQDQYGPGILRQGNAGGRLRRDYITIMISPSAAARVYAQHTSRKGLPNLLAEVM